MHPDVLYMHRQDNFNLLVLVGCTAALYVCSTLSVVQSTQSC